MIAVGSTLYGTTAFGGPAYSTGTGYGTVFSVPIGGGPVNVLASFNSTNGYSPEADLSLVGSTLYATTDGGGIHGQGNIFSIR